MNEVRRIIVETYQRYVRTTDEIPNDLKQWLKVDERLPVFFNNLERELNNNAHVVARGLTRAKIELMAWDMSRLFVQLLKRKKDEDAMSTVARAELKKQNDDAEKLKTQTEVFEQLGVERVSQDKKGETIHQTIRYDEAVKKLGLD